MTKVLDPMSTTRRRRWPVFVPVGLVIILAGLWTGFWFFASAKAETTLAGWREREAKSGRIYSCDKQTVGGYPFRIEVRCTDPTAELRTTEPPVALKAKDLLAAVQVYDPNLVLSEIQGPVTIGEPGKPPAYVANWKLGQSSVRGTPEAPERMSFSFEAPTVERVAESAATCRCSARSAPNCTAGWPADPSPTIRSSILRCCCSLPPCRTCIRSPRRRPTPTSWRCCAG